MKNVSRQKKCSIPEMLNENHALVFHHSLLHVRLALLTSTHDEERKNALKLMLILCEEMIPHATLPTVFRIAVTTLVWTIRQSATSNNSSVDLIKMLQKFISISFDKEEYILCGQYARDVIEGLLEVVESKP